MLVIRGTQRMLKELHLPPRELGEPGEGFLGSWLANLFRLERRKCVLFTNDQTLYSVLLFGLVKHDFDFLGQRFREGLCANLERDGFSDETIERVQRACHPVTWGTTNSRSVLGSMNEMIFTSKYIVALKHKNILWEILDLNRTLNRTPMKALKRIVAIDEMRAALKEWEP